MLEIIPAPGTENKNWQEIEKKIELAKPFARTIHIDVTDGIYVAGNTHTDPAPFKKYTKELSAGERGQMVGDSGLLFEVHLMVDNPIKYLKPFSDAGFQRFIAHIEKMPDQEEFLAEAQLLGEVGFALDKQTPPDAIKVPLDDLDSLLVMTIQAGYSGQKFIEPLLEKVKNIRAQNEYIPIEVDGGINDETITVAAAAGASRFVVTSALFGAEPFEKQFALLTEKLKMFENNVLL